MTARHQQLLFGYLQVFALELLDGLVIALPQDRKVLVAKRTPLREHRRAQPCTHSFSSVFMSVLSLPIAHCR